MVKWLIFLSPPNLIHHERENHFHKPTRPPSPLMMNPVAMHVDKIHPGSRAHHIPGLALEAPPLLGSTCLVARLHKQSSLSVPLHHEACRSLSRRATKTELLRPVLKPNVVDRAVKGGLMSCMGRRSRISREDGRGPVRTTTPLGGRPFGTSSLIRLVCASLSSAGYRITSPKRRSQNKGRLDWLSASVVKSGGFTTTRREPRQP